MALLRFVETAGIIVVIVLTMLFAYRTIFGTGPKKNDQQPPTTPS